MWRMRRHRRRARHRQLHPAGRAGRRIEVVTTVEGIESGRHACTRCKQAFAANGAVQCGFCIPGMIVTAANYLDRKPESNRGMTCGMYSSATSAAAPAIRNRSKQCSMQRGDMRGADED